MILATGPRVKINKVKVNFGFLPQIMFNKCSGHDYSKKKIGQRSDQQGHSDSKIMWVTPQSQDACIKQILDSYLK